MRILNSAIIIIFQYLAVEGDTKVGGTQVQILSKNEPVTF